MNKFDENGIPVANLFSSDAKKIIKLKLKNLNRSDLRKVEDIRRQKDVEFKNHLAFLKSHHLCLQQVVRAHLRKDHVFFNSEKENIAVKKMVSSIERNK
jgi:hypothetical protein